MSIEPKLFLQPFTFEFVSSSVNSHYKIYNKRKNGFNVDNSDSELHTAQLLEMCVLCYAEGKARNLA